MSEPTDLTVFRGTRKELCVYCGGDQHVVPLACPRIMAIEIDPELGCVVGIQFYAPDPPSAA